MIVVSDTSPVRYLVLIQAVEVLPKLFGDVLIPPRVLFELQRPRTPAQVRMWAASRPHWLQVRAPSITDPTVELDTGEAEAILLAQEVRADRLLIDDKKGRRVAAQRGLAVAGTLTVLAEASDKGLLDLRQAVKSLGETNFRAPVEFVRYLLERDAKRKIVPKEER